MVSCDVACHIMLFDVVVTLFVRCNCLCCVMSRNALRCHGDELLSVVPRNRMECYELKMPLVKRSRRVVQSMTMWWSQELFCTIKYCSVLQSTMLVLQKPMPVLRQYYKVLFQYYSSITKNYASTTLYSKVLLRYYSVL